MLLCCSLFTFNDLTMTAGGAWYNHSAQTCTGVGLLASYYFMQKKQCYALQDRLPAVLVLQPAVTGCGGATRITHRQSEGPEQCSSTWEPSRSFVNSGCIYWLSPHPCELHAA